MQLNGHGDNFYWTKHRMANATSAVPLPAQIPPIGSYSGGSIAPITSMTAKLDGPDPLMKLSYNCGTQCSPHSITMSFLASYNSRNDHVEWGYTSTKEGEVQPSECDELDSHDNDGPAANNHHHSKMEEYSKMEVFA